MAAANQACHGGAPRRRSSGAGRGNQRLLETLDWRPACADIDRIVGDALAWERKLRREAAA